MSASLSPSTLPGTTLDHAFATTILSNTPSGIEAMVAEYLSIRHYYICLPPSRSPTRTVGTVDVDMVLHFCRSMLSTSLEYYNLNVFSPNKIELLFCLEHSKTTNSEPVFMSAIFHTTVGTSL